jgi:murein L,D-transpeptidase YcbB/YkuD
MWTDAGGLNARARLAIAEIRKADDWGLKASAFQLPEELLAGADEDARVEAEIRLGLAALKYARHARGGRVDPQSVSKLLDRKPRLYDPRTLVQALAATDKPDVYLRELHPRHPQFRNLQKALVAARAARLAPAGTAPEPVEQAAEPAPAKAKGRQRKAAAPPRDTPDQTVMRIVANMERWRWMPDDLGAFHVWNNVPEQMSAVFKDGTEVFRERIVVGKPDTATPNFSANMQFVIFQPEWGVPPGIKNNEIAPLLRRASAESGGWFGESSRTPSSVLARHGLRVSVGGRVVNPDTVNWSTVDVNRFNFIQPSGPTNVLGVVKFRFPNKHDVYMHDTPQKHLFGASVRAFSHGCMRLQNPVRFAEVLLAHDKGWSADRVRSMVPRGGQVTLSAEIPVHNVYFTVIADGEGKLRTLGDLYGQDSRLASAIEGRSIAVASRGEPAAGGGVPGRPKVERQARPKRERGTATASRQDANPFAGLFGN